MADILKEAVEMFLADVEKDFPGLMDGIYNSVDTNISDIIYHTNSVVNENIYALNDEFYEGYQWIACLDSRTCMACAALDNKIFEVLPYMDTGEKYEEKGVRAPEQPLHHNCVTGDTLITTGNGISHITRRRYKGKMIVINTSLGNRLVCTPDHPVLTPKGFIAAKDIEQGEQLVLDKRFKSGSLSKNKNNRVSAIQDVFSTLMERGGAFLGAMEIPAKDLDNDFANNKVHIISPYREFSNKRDFFGGKDRREQLFMYGTPGTLSFINCLRVFAFGAKRYFMALYGNMRLFCNRFFHQIRCVLHTFNLLLFTITHGDSIESKKGNHLHSANTHRIGNSGNTYSFIKKFKNIFFSRYRNISVPIRRNLLRFKKIVDPVFGYTVLCRYIFYRYAGIIQFDHVVSSDIIEMDTHVYNLHTANNFYVANGIITHNCRCVMVPVLEGMAEEMKAGPNYHDWFEKQSNDRKLDILGPTRYKEYLGGREVTQFVKDGKVMTLKDMGLDRITRKELADKLHENKKTSETVAPKSSEAVIPEIKIEKEIGFDKKPLSSEQLQEYNDYLMSQNIGGVSETDKKKWADAVTSKIQKLPDKLQQIFYNTRTELTTRTEDDLEAYFDKGDLKIHMAKEYFKDTQTRIDAFFHEMGHALDYKYGKPSANINFRDDYTAFIETAKALGKLNKTQLYNVLKGNKRGDISDIFAGLSKGRYKGDYWHDPSQYKPKGAIQGEGFSHIVNSFQSDIRTEMKKFFPKAYEQFLSWLENVEIDISI